MTAYNNLKSLKLDDPILELSEDPRDHITLRDFLRASLIVGGTGSGKTSSSGRTIATEFLKRKWEGLSYVQSQRKENTGKP
jgi:hypothetical protein